MCSEWISEPFSGLFDTAQDPILVLTPTGTLVYANPCAERALPNLRATVVAALQNTNETVLKESLRHIAHTTLSLPIRLNFPTGEQVFKAWRIQVAGATGPESLIMMQGDTSAELRQRNHTLRSDVAHLKSRSAREQVEARQLREESAKLRRMASIDGLTGLVNADALEHGITTALAEKDVSAALIFIDLDNFKAVNDNFGHCAGDAVLRAVGMRIRLATRHDDLAARLGGDEFGYWCRGVTKEDARDIAQRLLDEIAKPIIWEGGTQAEVAISAHASLGIAFTQTDGFQFQDLKTAADLRMYHHKRLQRLNSETNWPANTTKAQRR